MIKRGIASWVVGLLVICITGIAQATLIKVSYQGTVTNISSRLIGGPVLLGDLISGHYIFDTTGGTPDVQKWGPNDEWSQTFFENALKDSFVTIGSEIFQFFGGFVRTDPNTTGQTAFSVHTRQGLISVSFV